jgi:hypothetical protein
MSDAVMRTIQDDFLAPVIFFQDPISYVKRKGLQIFPTALIALIAVCFFAKQTKLYGSLKNYAINFYTLYIE